MYQYVAIERQYGSGGRAVAGELARNLGWPCYGREILKKAGELLHIPVSELEHYEENATNSFLYTVSILGKAFDSEPDLLMREGHLFVAEQLAIRALAGEGPAVFLGHCAAEALKDSPHVLRVFIKSDLDGRRQRIHQEYEIPEGEIDSRIRRFDKKRSGYYSMNTAAKWQDPNNYDLILDSGTLGVRGCVASLTAVCK